MKIVWDTKDFDIKSAKATPAMIQVASKAVGEAGDELLRLSALEVPHDTGHLQGTGKVSKKKLEAAISYNTPYAVRLHEHPEFKFQKGRKAKYLESPLKNNVGVFKSIISERIKQGLK